MGGPVGNGNVHAGEEEKCKTTKELFPVLSYRFKPHQNCTIMSLQCKNLQRKGNESKHEWMSRMYRNVAECEYREYDRLLTEQLLYGLNDEGMTY